MKYIIKQINDDFIFEELELVRKQFIEALNYTLESANVFFDLNAKDSLDFYIAYDFQHKNGEAVIYGFNLRDEIYRNFKLDVNTKHSSKFLLSVGQQLLRFTLFKGLRLTLFEVGQYVLTRAILGDTPT